MAASKEYIADDDYSETCPVCNTALLDNSGALLQPFQEGAEGFCSTHCALEWQLDEEAAAEAEYDLQIEIDSYWR
jgi:hypothetical protein